MRNTRRPENTSPALLHSRVLLYPAAVFGDSSVDAGFVPASAAVAPAHHAGQEDPPTGAGDGQRAARVALRESERRVIRRGSSRSVLLYWRDYISRLAWERPGIPPEELVEVAGERAVWASLLRLLPRDLDADTRVNGTIWLGL